MTDHNVELDSAGGGWPRLTCHTCAAETRLRRPYMSDNEWQQDVGRFNRTHPSRPGRRLAYRPLLWATMGVAARPLYYVDSGDLTLRDGRAVAIRMPMSGPATFVITIEAEQPGEAALEIPCADAVSAAYQLNLREVGTAYL